MFLNSVLVAVIVVVVVVVGGTRQMLFLLISFRFAIACAGVSERIVVTILCMYFGLLLVQKVHSGRVRLLDDLDGALQHHTQLLLGIGTDYQGLGSSHLVGLLHNPTPLANKSIVPPSNRRGHKALNRSHRCFDGSTSEGKIQNSSYLQLQ